MASRSWVFTVNNFTFIPTALPQNGRYCIIAQEHINTNITNSEQALVKTPHLQGYIEMNTPCRFPAIQTWLQAKAHCEKRRGTRDQARDYCRKEDETPLELGIWIKSGQGTRTDINELFHDAKSLKPLRAIAKKHKGCYLRYHKAVQHVQHLFNKPDIRLDLDVSLYYGKPLTGKTKAAYDEDPDLFAVPLGKGFWFDGYTGQKTILIDDYCGEWRLVDLLRLLDVYPVQLPIKGGFVWLRATRIIITSNTALEYWYDYQTRQDSLAALQRRVHDTVPFTTIYKPPQTYECSTEEMDDAEQAKLDQYMLRCTEEINIGDASEPEEQEESTLDDDENPHHPLPDCYIDPCPGQKGKK